MITTQSEEQTVRVSEFRAYAAGMLSARYYALHHDPNDSVYNGPLPDPPKVVAWVLDNLCDECLAAQLFEVGWSSLDPLLRCSSIAEIEKHYEEALSPKHTH